MRGHPHEAPGPFRSHQIRDGDPYELSDGHAIRCMTAGERHANANLAGGRVLATDPAVAGAAGVDAGFSFNDDKNLRAPGISVGVGTSPGWMRTAPPLAVEYADKGQDEPQLQQKIRELLAAGTKFLWVVRLAGAIRVEVHTPGEPTQVVPLDGVLTAPGVLTNPVPVRALVETRAADAATLRNLLNAAGYESVEAIRAEGYDAGVRTGLIRVLLQLLEARGLRLNVSLRARVEGCTDAAKLGRWIVQTASATTADAALD